MLNFFRSKRRNLLNTKGIGKYMLYAFGEIILVVVGILIALAVDNGNQKKQNEADTIYLLEDVLADLEEDILEINENIRLSRFYDSLYSHVLENKLTKEDFENSSIHLRLAISSGDVSINKSAYENLIGAMERIPDKFQPLLPILDKLYGYFTNDLDMYILNQNEIVYEIEKRYANEYDWYSMSQPEHRDQRIEYVVNDPRHKNDIKLRSELNNEQLGDLEEFLFNAKWTYFCISNSIGTNDSLPAFIDIPFYSKDELSDFSGTYYDKENERRYVVNPSEFSLKIQGVTARRFSYFIDEDITRFPGNFKLEVRYDRDESGNVYRYRTFFNGNYIATGMKSE